MLTLSALSVRLLGDAGIGWHIRTGQLILATHAIPRLDPFSATMSGHAWFAWEWLYDVLAGWLESVAGLDGVVWFTAVTIATVFAWTFQLLLRRGTNVFLALILVLLAVSAAMVHFLARPHVVSWLFTVAWFWILDSTEASDSSRSRVLERSVSQRRLWLLPLSMLVWVNVHGGFVIGFALLGIYWIGAGWAWCRLTVAELQFAGVRFEDVLRKAQAAWRLRLLSRAGVLSALATVVNPYGFQLHEHIYRYLSNRFLMDHIDEFQSPNFHYVAQKCFAALLLLTLVSLAAKRRSVKLSDPLIVLFAAYSGLYASRNLPASSLLLILIIGPWLSDAADGIAERFISGRKAGPTLLQRMKAIDLRLRGHLWPAAAILLSGCLAAHGGSFDGRRLMNAHFDARRFPVAAVNYLEQRGAQGSILSVDYWGGYLIYRLSPRAKVVIDDRHDFYGELFLKSYLKMVHLEPGWDEFLKNYP
ncbi:MAG: hypothetical protein WBX38_22225, partial [Candidatus Sulfotelmatobacter sp.]